MTPRYRARQPLDTLVVDGESIVLLPPDQVVRLSALATTIVAAASEPVTAADLAGLVEGLFGPPADGTTTDALRAVLGDLAAAGVLEEVTGG